MHSQNLNSINNTLNKVKEEGLGEEEGEAVCRVDVNLDSHCHTPFKSLAGYRGRASEIFPVNTPTVPT